ncbi:MAG: hypothetical protein Q7V63_07215 [Gammaproteobacteria bacterium]|nr:hypothetical protein [Gammaproteobacteria bacterium]
MKGRQRTKKTSSISTSAEMPHSANAGADKSVSTFDNYMITVNNFISSILFTE